MNTNELTNKDREVLFQALREYRKKSTIETDEDDMSNRDELERKLQRGGQLIENDLWLLEAVVANEIPDNDFYDHLMEVLNK